jgi:NADH-quinone oxidoreductase subunit E/NADP-reducing hydrogenase subunit HndA
MGGSVGDRNVQGGGDALKQTLEAILPKSHGGKQALIPLLQEVQKAFGYIPEEAIFAISDRTGVSASEVFGVLTFYAQFRLTPQGRNVVKVCRGTACHVRGGTAVRKALEKVLGIQPGQTTPDMEYTLETVACIGACALAPTMVINENVYGQMSARKVEEVFSGYSGGKDG